MHTVCLSVCKCKRKRIQNLFSFPLTMHFLRVQAAHTAHNTFLYITQVRYETTAGEYGLRKVLSRDSFFLLINLYIPRYPPPPHRLPSGKHSAQSCPCKRPTICAARASTSPSTTYVPPPQSHFSPLLLLNQSSRFTSFSLNPNSPSSTLLYLFILATDSVVPLRAAAARVSSPRTSPPCTTFLFLFAVLSQCPSFPLPLRLRCPFFYLSSTSYSSQR